MTEKKTLEWSDIYPFIYLYALFEGLNKSEVTKHLVIDEMQDYTPIQYTVINLIFPCQKTILGDFNQLVNPNYIYTIEDIKQLYKNAEFITLNKSYRSTYKIMTFANQIKNINSLETIKRHGENLKIILCCNEEDEKQHIKKLICCFSTGKNSSFGIILKTNNMSKILYNILSKEFKINLISSESTVFNNGISITSIQMSKGLEFDEVIIPKVMDFNYFSNYDSNLLYIACTRAMHKLTFMYIGNITNFIFNQKSKI